MGYETDRVGFYNVPQVLVLDDRLLDAGLDALEGELVGCSEGDAVLVAGLFGLEHWFW